MKGYLPEAIGNVCISAMLSQKQNHFQGGKAASDMERRALMWLNDYEVRRFDILLQELHSHIVVVLTESREQGEIAIVVRYPRVGPMFK
jgi:hypothetical protein